MVVLLIHSAKIAMKQEDLKSVFNVLHQPTDILLCLNMLVFARKVSTMTKEFVNHAHQAVLSAQMPQLVKDALFQPPTILTVHVHALKATSSPLNL